LVKEVKHLNMVQLEPMLLVEVEEVMLLTTILPEEGVVAVPSGILQVQLRIG
jgi:hypothetical protein